MEKHHDPLLLDCLYFPVLQLVPPPTCSHVLLCAVVTFPYVSARHAAALFLPCCSIVFSAVSRDLSDHQAVFFDPGQDGTISLSHSFQPCPPDLFLLLFFLLLSCTPPCEMTSFTCVVQVLFFEHLWKLKKNETVIYALKITLNTYISIYYFWLSVVETLFYEHLFSQN